MATATANAKTMSCSFEVFGRVQGKDFKYEKKYTKDKATSLGISGWCRNTEIGSVKGEIEGDIDKMAIMKDWLEKTGSPSSSIDNAKFSNIETNKPRKYQGFDIKK